MPTELAAREWARPAQPLEWEWARAKLATQKLAQATWGRPRATQAQARPRCSLAERAG